MDSVGQVLEDELTGFRWGFDGGIGCEVREIYTPENSHGT